MWFKFNLNFEIKSNCSHIYMCIFFGWISYLLVTTRRFLPKNLEIVIK